MFFAVILDYLRARIRTVDYNLSARLFFKLVNNLNRKAVRKCRQRIFETMPAISQWPIVVSLPAESSRILANAAV